MAIYCKAISQGKLSKAELICQKEQQHSFKSRLEFLKNKSWKNFLKKHWAIKIALQGDLFQIKSAQNLRPSNLHKLVFKWEKIKSNSIKFANGTSLGVRMIGTRYFLQKLISWIWFTKMQIFLQAWISEIALKIRDSRTLLIISVE